MHFCLAYIHLISLSLASALCVLSGIPRPVAIWHGLGDAYDSPSQQRLISQITAIHKDIEVHPIFVNNASSSADQQASLQGNLNLQIPFVCDQLWSWYRNTSYGSITTQPGEELGFDAIGFSQGGLFLRAAIERCNLPIRTLITFGSPHNGISDFLYCTGSAVCRVQNAVLKRQALTNYQQTHIIPAQYFRDPKSIEDYLERSLFLADVNNEHSTLRNETYISNISQNLRKLVLISFAQDTTVIPKESAWFQDGPNIPLRHRKLYTEDWIGLRALEETHGPDAIETLELNGQHMQIENDDFESIVKMYLGKRPSETGCNKLLVQQGP